MKLRGVILDLDGTLYRGEAEVPGASAFVVRIRAAGARPLFVTNRANRAPAEVAAQIRSFGVACDAEDVLTSAEATAQHLRLGSVFVIGEQALRDALQTRGMTLTDRRPDYVVVSLDREFTYAKLRQACTLIRAGARFIATNPDKGLATQDGVTPGTGALVAAVAAASGVEPVIIGKPERLIIDMALERLGLQAGEVIAVGDNVETDVPAGLRAGVRTALILTGVSTREDAGRGPHRPTWVVDGYGELTGVVERLLKGED